MLITEEPEGEGETPVCEEIESNSDSVHHSLTPSFLTRATEKYRSRRKLRETTKTPRSQRAKHLMASVQHFQSIGVANCFLFQHQSISQSVPSIDFVSIFLVYLRACHLHLSRQSKNTQALPSCNFAHTKECTTKRTPKSNKLCRNRALEAKTDESSSQATPTRHHHSFEIDQHEVSGTTGLIDDGCTQSISNQPINSPDSVSNGLRALRKLTKDPSKCKSPSRRRTKRRRQG